MLGGTRPRVEIRRHGIIQRGPDGATRACWCACVRAARKHAGPWRGVSWLKDRARYSIPYGMGPFFNVQKTKHDFSFHLVRRARLIHPSPPQAQRRAKGIRQRTGLHAQRTAHFHTRHIVFQLLPKAFSFFRRRVPSFTVTVTDTTTLNSTATDTSRGKHMVCDRA